MANKILGLAATLILAVNHMVAALPVPQEQQLVSQPGPSPSDSFADPEMSLQQGFLGLHIGNGLRNSPTQANMQAAAGGMRGPGLATNPRLNIDDLKGRAVMVQKAIKELDSRRLTLIAQGGGNPNMEFELNGLRMKIVEHQQLLQRIGRMIQMASASMAPNVNGLQGAEMSNANHMVAPSPVSQPGAGPGPSSMSVTPNNLPVQNGNAMPGSSIPSNIGMSGVDIAQHENSLLDISQLVGITDPQQILQLLKWSILSNDQLRQQGVPGQLIDKVELHRTILQRTYEGEIRFREQLQKNQALANSGNPTAAAAAVLQRQRLLQNAHAQAQVQVQVQAQAQAQAAQAEAQQQQHKPGMRPGQTPDLQLMPHQSPGSHQQQPSAGPASLSHTQAQNGQSQTRRTRPSPEDVQKALQFVSVVKNEYAQRTKTLKFINVPEQERVEYNTAFEQLYRHVTDMDTKMHVYASFMKDEGVRKLIAVIATAHHQRALLSFGTPKYILDLKTVRSMTEQMRVAQRGLQSYVLNLSGTTPNGRQPPQ